MDPEDGAGRRRRDRRDRPTLALAQVAAQTVAEHSDARFKSGRWSVAPLRTLSPALGRVRPRGNRWMKAESLQPTAQRGLVGVCLNEQSEAGRARRPGL